MCFTFELTGLRLYSWFCCCTCFTAHGFMAILYSWCFYSYVIYTVSALWLYDYTVFMVFSNVVLMVLQLLYTHDLMVMLFSLMQRYIMLYLWFYGQSVFMVLLSVYTRGFMALLYSWFFGYGFTVMLYSRFFCSCGVVARCTAART